MNRILHVGLGEIGREVVRAILQRGAVATLCGVVDPHPALAGKTLRDVMGGDVPPVPIVSSIAQAIDQQKADVAIVTTGSRMPQVRGTFEELAAAKIPSVSSCEELAFPQLRHARIAEELDAIAKANGVAILGTGVNPGFAMDAFALAASAACTQVRHIRCVRSLDAGKRRPQLQKKVAAGMTLEQFKQGLADKKLGHVGLAESAALLAAGLGWTLDEVDERFDPVVAASAIKASLFNIQPGQVRGMRMTAFGRKGSKTLVELDLTMAFAAETFDEVHIDADPPIHVRVTTGFPGDHSTVGLLVNCAQAVRHLRPGLRTMLDVVPVRSVAA
jgi:4-hydroxy-tetrahydrodipicolinate reductase